MDRRPLPQEHQLRPPLAQGEEEREQEGADQEPGRNLRLDAGRAGHRAQHEAHRHDHHVEQEDALEPEGVGEAGAEVTRHHGEGASTEREGAPESARGEDRGGERCRLCRKAARGDGRSRLMGWCGRKRGRRRRWPGRPRWRRRRRGRSKPAREAGLCDRRAGRRRRCRRARRRSCSTGAGASPRAASAWAWSEREPLEDALGQRLDREHDEPPPPGQINHSSLPHRPPARCRGPPRTPRRRARCAAAPRSWAYPRSPA